MTQVSRRGFVSGGAAALMAAHVGIGTARAAAISPERKLMRGIQADFERARKRHRWTKGLENVARPRLETPEMVIKGTWPDALKGNFFRTGPAVHERGGERYGHWFDGDGMIQRYGIEGGQVSHHGQMIETPKYKIEERGGRFLLPTFGTMVDSDLPVNQADDINVANINVLPMADEVLALWEGGSATSINSDTLATNGFKTWSGRTKGLPFSAHPKVEPDGTVWNFGIANAAGRVVLWHISPQGELLNVKVHPLEPNGMVHDFIVTENHLILLVPPFLFGDPVPPFVDAFAWHDGEASVALIFDKETLSFQRRVEMEGDFHFHFGNAWEDRDGTIRFDYCATANANFAMQGARDLMRGQFDKQKDIPTHHYHVRIAKSGKVTRELLGENAEFPRVDPRLVGRRNRFVYSMWQPDIANSPFFEGLSRIDLTLGRRDTFHYGSHIAADEHIFVPRPGGVDDEDGWVLGSVLDLNTGLTVLNLFDARAISDGPIASAHLPYAIPMGLHGAFQRRS